MELMEMNYNEVITDLEAKEKGLVETYGEILELEKQLATVNEEIENSLLMSIKRDIEHELNLAKKMKDNKEELMTNILVGLGLKKVVLNNNTELALKTTEQVKLVSDISKVPKEFIRTKEVVTHELDKIAVKQWLKETGEIPAGTEIVYNNKLVYKGGK
jgi:hypothetical protein